MRKITAIICSIMFAVFGIGLAMNTTSVGSNTMLAATPAVLHLQNPSAPLGPLMDQAQSIVSEAPLSDNTVDSLTTRIKELEKKVTATKSRIKNVKRNGATKTRGDTIYVDRPVYYLATKIGEESNQSLEYYEVTKLDSIPQ